MQFCNYARARSIPLAAEAGTVRGGRAEECPRYETPSPLPAASSRTTREYLNFVSFPRRYSFIRAGAPSRAMINRRIQSPDARNARTRARHPFSPPSPRPANLDNGHRQRRRALLICLLDKIRLFFGCRRERCGLYRTSRERASARARASRRYQSRKFIAPPSFSLLLFLLFFSSCLLLARRFYLLSTFSSRSPRPVTGIINLGNE